MLSVNIIFCSVHKMACSKERSEMKLNLIARQCEDVLLHCAAESGMCQMHVNDPELLQGT